MITLRQRQAVAALAAFLYDFLPGTPHPYADAKVSFRGVAHEVGLAECWQDGSKQPAIQRLLTCTLEGHIGHFNPLVIAIVTRAMSYSRVEITREKIVRLNELLAVVGYKIPELWDRGFLDGLPRAARSPAPPPETLAELAADLRALDTHEPAARGYRFQEVLTAFFEACALKPRRPFRVSGSEIDGSIDLDGVTYLVEARWEGGKVGSADLITFAGKVAGKAEWSRGIFVSVSGFTDDGLAALSAGRRVNVICLNGLDLHLILTSGLDLTEVIRRQARRAAETNEPHVGVRELFPDLIR